MPTVTPQIMVTLTLVDAEGLLTLQPPQSPRTFLSLEEASRLVSALLFDGEAESVQLGHRLEAALAQARTLAGIR